MIETVRELIAELQKMDPDAEPRVCYQWPYFSRIESVYVPESHITGPCVVIGRELQAVSRRYKTLADPGP